MGGLGLAGMQFFTCDIPDAQPRSDVSRPTGIDRTPGCQGPMRRSVLVHPPVFDVNIPDPFERELSIRVKTFEILRMNEGIKSHMMINKISLGETGDPLTRGADIFIQTRQTKPELKAVLVIGDDVHPLVCLMQELLVLVSLRLHKKLYRFLLRMCQV